jgi:hypothetical protein
MHGDLLMAMDSGDSSRRQRQAGSLAVARFEIDLCLELADPDDRYDRTRDDRDDREAEAGTATRRKPGCRSCASRFRLMSSL